MSIGPWFMSNRSIKFHKDLFLWAHDKMRSGPDLRADLNGDNLRISTACLRISDHCRVTVTVRVMVRVRIKVRVRVRFRVANCCIQQSWNWVTGSMGHLGHLSRLGHRVTGSSL